jgi:hypothetical protein
MASATVAAASPAEIPSPPPAWSLPLRIAFRFFCCYWILYMLPWRGHSSLIAYVPGSQFFTDYYIRLWQTICPWVAINVFHLSGDPTTYFPTGSGDTALAYIQHLCFLVLAIAGTLAWSIPDRKRADYVLLHEWLRIALRFNLFAAMYGYGFAKVFPSQFQYPDAGRMIEPFGQLSPMGVLWSFMGSSPAYTIFCGAAEVAGGAFLLFRRTTPLGALLCMAAMANVAVLNFSYDVPVKLYSVNLLAMSIFLLAPDIKRISSVLVLNRATLPSPSRVPWDESRRWIRWSAAVLKVVFIGYNLYGIHDTWKSYDDRIRHPNPTPLAGLYEVDAFTTDGVERPPLATDSTRWWKVAITGPFSRATIRTMDDTITRYSVKVDVTKRTVTFTGGNAPFSDIRSQMAFSYTRADDEHLTLTQDHMKMTLRKVGDMKFPLANRGFHWINELPFNR